ncbi:unnamed protein product [Trifolium pratense]|uniref:Uncharacterized protein n=1 Tax=Trifolium pratense TaxID=57577 RepID=A0ACB0LP36_TRIPR|nr:unnamed protein product [Trifolium pratense]
MWISFLKVVQFCLSVEKLIVTLVLGSKNYEFVSYYCTKIVLFSTVVLNHGDLELAYGRYQSQNETQARK